MVHSVARLMKIFRLHKWQPDKDTESTVRKGMNVLTTCVYLASFLLIIGIIYDYGFIHTAEQRSAIQNLYNVVWSVFFIDITLHLFIEYSKFTRNTYRRLAWILSVFLYMALIPVVFHQPEFKGVSFYLWKALDSRVYIQVVLLLFSLLNLSNGLVRILGKRTNPSLILAVGLLIFILIGTGLLLLPRSTVNGIDWIDALFVATSAVSITGLSSVDVVSTFTMEGLVIIIILVQIGGLGVMTLTSFFALFFMGNTSIYNQLVVRDMVSSDSLSSLFSTLLYILVFTLVVEGVGMLAIWSSIHGTMDMHWTHELAFSAFHSISAFCNAGFTTLPGNFGDPMVIGNYPLLIWISLLIIIGGIGFPILVNLKNIVQYYLKRFWSSWFKAEPKAPRSLHLYHLNTRIVFTMTFILLVSGTLFFVWFEWDNTLSDMDTAGKWTHAFFNAVCPRSGGFSSVNLSLLGVQTILIYILLMWIGGGSQSTAGGIKVNAFAVIMLNLGAIIRGKDRVEAFGRELSQNSLRRSHATVVMSFCILVISMILLSIFEPELSLFALTFECVSALSTTGASLNTSPLLSDASKILITLLMFIGRVGLITIMLGIVKQKKNQRYKFPQEQIIIN